MNLAVFYRSVRYFFYGLEADSVEAEDPSRCGEPQISISSLLDIKNCTKAIIRGPHRMMEARYLAR